MLEHDGVSEANWREATAKHPHFGLTETPRDVGRAVVALAADPARTHWSGQSLASGQLAKVYGFPDLDGSQPEAWRSLREVQDAGKPADATRYRSRSLPNQGLEPPASSSASGPQRSASQRLKDAGEDGGTSP